VRWRGWGRKRDLRSADLLAREANELIAGDRWAAAEAALRRAVELRGRWTAPDSMGLLSDRHLLAVTLFVQRRREEAAAEFLGLLTPFAAVLGEDHTEVAEARLMLSL
jgi:hypothetical protein